MRETGGHDDRFAFGGGCHWCTEAVFQHVEGVREVRQGFAASIAPHEASSEAAWVVFDPRSLTLERLVEIHLATHASASAHSMRGKYRSAVYARGDDALALAREALVAAATALNTVPVTRALPFVSFTPSDPRYQDYYRSDPDRPFCRVHIEPKLARLKALPFAGAGDGTSACDG